jgi:hypothetical protein
MLKISLPVSLPARRVLLPEGFLGPALKMPLVSDTPVGNGFFERHTDPAC